MPKTLKSFEFKAGVGAKSSYDWDTLLSGRILQLEAGKDYDCKDTTMATLIRNAAKRRGQTVQTNKVEGGMVIKASDPTTAVPPSNGDAGE